MPASGSSDDRISVGLDGLGEIASRLAPSLAPPKVAYIHGVLGAGKTTLVRALLAQWGCAEPVPSPSFSLVQSYSLSAGSVHHLDLYRIEDASEIECIGVRDLLDGESTLLIEWPEKARDGDGRMLLPPADISIQLAFDAGDSQRRLIDWAEHGRR